MKQWSSVEKAEKDYETLTKEIDLKDITWEKADQYIKNLCLRSDGI